MRERERERESYTFKINKINRSKYIDNIELFNCSLKKEDLFIHPTKSCIHPTKSYKEMG